MNLNKIILISLLSLSCLSHGQINQCYISYSGTKKLNVKGADKLPKTAAISRELKSDSGIVEVSRIAGYRVLYYNKKKAPFVNLKVEKSAKGEYETDKKHLLWNLQYLGKNSSGLESKEVTEYEVNGYIIYGINRSSIEKGSNLGTYIMFPGSDITVYFYFNNLKPKHRTIKSLDGFKKVRDLFFEEYTEHINACL